LLWEYEEPDFITLPQKFIDYVNLINTQIADDNNKLHLNRCCILARGHSTLSKFRSRTDTQLKTVELIANALRCWGNTPRTGKDMQNALEQLGKSLCVLFYKGKGNPQNQYCPDVYTFIEWRKLVGNILEEAYLPKHKLFPFEAMTWSL